ncbi:uncharacterized protein LOC110696196 [Chenopodium quinoa]|uniref:uncharacterized protein LOC110696196 n=1 Tax=Chenopodium quinoa TaxID=63459 RepID=UPI000B785670|nr:uncharacterized protein LOC110696196 [Chenopodium quinoa]
MHHLCSLSPQTPLPTTTNNYFHFFNPNNSTTNHGLYGINWRFNPLNMLPKRGIYHQGWIISSAMENDSNFEVDQDKARQALSDLDQQLDSLSSKQVNPPKIRASSIGDLKGQVRDEPPEISGSYLGYTAFVLFLFTIFYNVLFYTVIKPSVDGPDEDIASTDVTLTYQTPDVISQP